MGELMLAIGIKGREEWTVEEKYFAKTLGSGTLEVFATPAMVALMELTAWKSVKPELNEGEGTVGISLDIRHISATPSGMCVYCESELIGIDGKKLTFSLKAYDEAGLIGEGTHERFIVNDQKFQKNTNLKKQ